MSVWGRGPNSFSVRFGSYRGSVLREHPVPRTDTSLYTASRHPTDICIRVLCAPTESRESNARSSHSSRQSAHGAHLPSNRNVSAIVAPRALGGILLSSREEGTGNGHETYNEIAAYLVKLEYPECPGVASKRPLDLPSEEVVLE